MNSFSEEIIIMTRDCEATLIPFGNSFTLKKGDEVRITQALGGSYTVMARGSLFRIEAKNADAIGKEGYHPIAPLSYYQEALKRFDNDTPCFVFTDDLDWCKSQEYFKQDRFLFNENVQRYDYKSRNGLGESQYTILPHIDLCLMSLCSGAIIANSSFSWWGAWLQNNRGNVIAPDPWYGSKNSHLDTSDIIPDRWNSIPWSIGE